MSAPVEPGGVWISPAEIYRQLGETHAAVIATTAAVDALRQDLAELDARVQTLEKRLSGLIPMGGAAGWLVGVVAAAWTAYQGVGLM